MRFLEALTSEARLRTCSRVGLEVGGVGSVLVLGLGLVLLGSGQG